MIEEENVNICLQTFEKAKVDGGKGITLFMGGVVKVKIYEVDTKIALYVDTFLLQL
jgi:hypothetical protein